MRRRARIRRFFRDPVGAFSTTVLVVVTMSALFAPVLTSTPPNAVDPWNMLAEPSPNHWFGTDDLGRDLFSRVLHAGRITLLIGLLSSALAVGIGTILGLVSGWYGGWLDIAIGWITNTFLTVPLLAVALIVGAFLDLNAWRLSVVIGCLVWPSVSRVVRGQVLTLKEWPFIEAARALGVPTRRLLLGHITPNLLAPVFVSARLLVGFAILVESALSFLGFGVSPPTATWGKMLHEAQVYFREAWWMATFPGIAISITVAAVNLGGDALSDAVRGTSQVG